MQFCECQNFVGYYKLAQQLNDPAAELEPELYTDTFKNFLKSGRLGEVKGF